MSNGEFKTEVGEFKGSKTFSIFKGDKRVLSFGLNKAKAILACIDLIRDFVATNDKSVQPNLETEHEEA
jgi:hypothetical protein